MLTYYIAGILFLIIGVVLWWPGITSSNILLVVVGGLIASFGAAILITTALGLKKSPGKTPAGQDKVTKAEPSPDAAPKRVPIPLRKINLLNAAAVGKHFGALAMAANEDGSLSLAVLEVDNDEIVDSWSGTDVKSFMEFCKGFSLVTYDDRKLIHRLSELMKKEGDTDSISYMDIMPLVRKVYPGRNSYKFHPLMEELEIYTEETGLAGKSEMLAELFINVLDDEKQSNQE